MYFKNLIANIIATLTISCSSFKDLIYHPDINQGNYFTVTDIDKIDVGMTQQQVIYTLGTPMIQDYFGGNVWFYIFRQQSGHEFMYQKTLTLFFDSRGFLTKIKKDYKDS